MIQHYRDTPTWLTSESESRGVIPVLYSINVLQTVTNILCFDEVSFFLIFYLQVSGTNFSRLLIGRNAGIHRTYGTPSSFLGVWWYYS